MKRVVFTLFAIGVGGLMLAVAVRSQSVRAQQPAALRAALINIAGIPLGEVTITEIPGGTQIAIQAAGFDPVPGDHRAIIAGAGVCDPPDFATVGATELVLPNIQFFHGGEVTYAVPTTLPLSDLRDANGAALVIFADTEPEPGEPIACAVLVPPGASPTEVPAPQGTEAVSPPPALPAAELIMKLGIPLGVANVEQVGDLLHVGIVASGFDPVASTHRVAFTTVGRCAPPQFASAGHDVVVLPTLFINAAGAVEYTITTDATSLAQLRDADGTALVIYANHQEPFGERIACGVVFPGGPAAVPVGAAPTATIVGAPSPTPLPTPTATQPGDPSPTPLPTPTGTETPSAPPTMTPSPGPNCDASYPRLCIPPPPPDLDCDDVPFDNFQVLPPDPHIFDPDNDGIGCER